MLFDVSKLFDISKNISPILKRTIGPIRDEKTTKTDKKQK